MHARPLTLLLVLAPLAGAQDSPFRSPLVDVGGFALAAAAGDVDADGDADLVTNDNTDVFLALQTSPGVFAQPVLQASIPFITRMTLGDFDHDGDLDLASAVDTGNPSAADLVAVMLSLGSSFGAPSFRVTAQDPTDVVAADFDEDGDLDLALPCSAKSFAGTGTRISIFFGFGNGSFTPKLDVLGGPGPQGVDVADVHLDGHLDLAVINALGLLRTLQGDGHGAFTVLAGAEVGAGATDVALGDVDADGDTDALVAYTHNWCELALGDGAGAWAVQPFLALPTNSQRPALADLDEDGDADIITLQAPPTPDPARCGFAVALSHGDGSFAPVQLPGSAQPPRDLVVADLTQDGDLDLFGAIAVNSTASGALLPGDGRGGFGGNVATGHHPDEAVLVDLDLDGKPELIAACSQGPNVSVSPGLGHAAFGVPLLLDFANTPAAVVAADIVEDGFPDLLAINGNNPGGITVRAGAGALVFGPAIHTAMPDIPWGLGSGDANLDGHLDLVLACNGGTAQVFVGDGDGGFLKTASVATASFSPDAAAFGDLNGDGLPDLVATTTAAFGITTALGNGLGEFSPPTQVPITHHNQHDVALGDLDGDDDLDIVSGGGFTGALNVILNDGAAHFTAGPALTAMDTWGVAIADVDDDGVTDVIAGAEHLPTSQDFGAVFTWHGLGGGAFAAPSVAIAPANTEELLLADLDGDGHRDAAALAVKHDEIWFLPNVHGPWQPLGKGLAGTQGLPRQQGFGTLVPGQPFEFLLTDARPLGATWHVIGLSAIDANFKGGTLVPTPNVITGPWPLDAAGELSIQGNWPGPVASGVPLWFQFLSQDAAAVKGWSLSNALKATLP